jgi:integrase/recombinase XerD
MNASGEIPVLVRADVLGTERTRMAVLAYLARYKGHTRTHAESDLRSFLAWCGERDIDALSISRAQIEVWVRWMQEIRGLQPATVSRRVSVIAGFYRTCVIDGVLAQSPAEYVRRPRVPTDSPTLGLTHLQFEAMLHAAAQSVNVDDLALVALLGLLGLRVFEACGVNIADLGEEHGHQVLRVRGKGDKVVLVPLPPSVKRAIDGAIDGHAAGPVLRSRTGARMDRSCASRRLRRLAASAGVRLPRMQTHMLRHTFVTTVSTPASTCATSRSLPGTHPAHHHALRPRPP